MPTTQLRQGIPLIATGFLLTFWSSPGQTFFISLFGDELRAVLNLNHAQFGALYSTATLLSAVILLWSGTLIDRYPLPTIIAAVVAMLSASLLLLSAAKTIAVAFIALLLLRHLGQGLMMLIASSSIVRYLDKLRGRGNALSGMGYACAEAALPVTVIWLTTQYGWQLALQFSAIILLLAILPVLMLLLRGHSERHKRYLASIHEPATAQHSHSTNNTDLNYSLVKHWTRHEVLRDKCFYMLLPLLLAHPMLFTGFIFHQLYLVDAKGWSLELWGQLFTLYAVCGVFAKLLAGFIIDRFSAIRIAPIGVCPLAIGLLFLALSSQTYAAWMFMLFLGLTTGIQTTVSAPFWVEIYGSRYIGSIKSVTTFSVVAATAITPVGMGWLIDTGTSIKTLALGSVGYITVAIVLALIALPICKDRASPTTAV